MTYTHRIFNSIEEIDTSDWLRVRSACGDEMAMDPRFIAAVEISMKHKCRFWYVLVYNESGLPVACASLSTLTINLANFAHPMLAWVIRHAPVFFHRLRQLKLLVCGLPIPTGHHTLGIAPPSASAEALPIIDKTICELAAEMKVDAIVYKEFGKADPKWMSPLLGLGYQQISAPPMYVFKQAFQDFSQYCAALRHRYRQSIIRSRRKLERAGALSTVFTGHKEILSVYTPEVHALYHQMADRAKIIKEELLSIEFLHQLAIHLKGDMELVSIIKDSKIIAFAWCLHAAPTYYPLYGGLDYAWNHDLDLYSNLMYALLDRALQKKVSSIEFGMGADAFKVKLGCHSEPIYAFAKGVGHLMSLLVRVAPGLLIAQAPAVKTFNLYRTETKRSSPGGTQLYAQPGASRERACGQYASIEARPPRKNKRPAMRIALLYIKVLRETLSRVGLLMTVQLVLHELAFDMLHRTRTAAFKTVDDKMDVVGDNQASSLPSQSINPVIFRRAIAELPIQAQRARFVDFGCGRGRAVIMAARLGFSKVIGVEFSQSLCEEASRNVAKAAPRHDIVVLHQDACDYVITREDNVFFLFNPFTSGPLKRVAANIRCSWETSPRPLWVVYANPVWGDEFSRQDFAELRTLNGHKLDYRIFHLT
jgi:predicted RNA methylase